jgi:TolB-like protein/tetratricopeptide (TPR) repeat protein
MFEAAYGRRFMVNLSTSLKGRLAAAALSLAGLLAAQAGHAAAPTVSLAVLPFANTSGDAGQDAFADGVADEIGASFAQIPELRVGARTSASRVKGQTDTRAIGMALGRLFLLQGSVKKTNGNIRIEARLVRAADGMQLWSQTYDGALSGFFDMEEDMASHVAGALNVSAGTLSGEKLTRDRTANMDAFEKYLRAKPLIRARGQKPFADAAVLLEQSVAADPNFAPAVAMLAFDYDLTPLYSPSLRSGNVADARKLVDTVIPKAQELARHATQLSPRRSDAYVASAYANLVQGKLMQADTLFRQALALDPQNTDGMHGYSQLLAAMGEVKESIRMRESLQALEPFVVNYVADTAEIIWLDTDNPKANETAIRMLNDFRPNRTMELAQVQAALGHFMEAATVLREMNPNNYAPGVLEAAAKLLESAPAKAADPASLPRLNILGWVYLYVGAPDRVMEYYENNLAAGYFQPISTTWFWHPTYTPVRKSERFKEFARHIGLVDVWQRVGWPDQCEGNDFDDRFTCQ